MKLDCPGIRCLTKFYYANRKAYYRYSLITQRYELKQDLTILLFLCPYFLSSKHIYFSIANANAHKRALIGCLVKDIEKMPWHDPLQYFFNTLSVASKATILQIIFVYKFCCTDADFVITQTIS